LALNRKKFSLVLTLVFTVLFITSITQLHASTPDVRITPTSGKADTNIFLKIRGASVDGYCYLYWDDILLLNRISQTTDENSPGTGFDITFNPPDQSPYSDPGEHVLTIELEYNVFVEQPRLHKEARTYSTSLSFVIVNGEDSEDIVSNDVSKLTSQLETLQEEYDELQRKYLDALIQIEELKIEENPSNDSIPGFPIQAIVLSLIGIIIYWRIRQNYG